MALEPLQYGTVTGRFLAAVADTLEDEDLNPNALPLTGTVIFTPDAKYIKIPNGTGGPATVVPSTITATLDNEGYVSHNGVRGINLIASNNPGINPENFTWTVTPILFQQGTQLRYPSWSMTVVANTNNDLTVTAPLPSSGGSVITRGAGIKSARTFDGALILTLDDGSELEPVTLPPGSGVHVQPTNPQMVAPGLWIQTGLGTSGTDFTFWIEDGQ